MSLTAFSLVEAALLVAGALGAGRLTQWLSKSGDRKVILMASVASWFILFGMVPFGVFTFFVGSASRGTIGPLTTTATFVLNLIPFAMISSPLIGFGLGIKASRRRRRT